ncbi:MAG TPA: glycoside hydrolase family 88 protein [Candidatus Limnocylindrales bacterium]|nr:glycoside hydrolase family 88 protein [Candidatus Limnocylindrales bacterium]
MDSAEIKINEVRNALERLTTNASRELLVKQPHWGDAILCDGLLYAAHALKSDAPIEAAQRWFEPKLATGPRTNGWFWFWAAEALPALDLHLRTSDPRYLEYARAIVAFMENTAARTHDGAFVPHPPALEVWIDVCYFTAPALALLGRISGDSAMLERAADQMILHRDHLIDPDSGLFWHVAYVDKKSHSRCLWARGNSWFSIGAPQVLAEIEAAGGTKKLASKIEKIRDALANQLNKVAALQDESGLWHTVIDRDDSYLESSAAAGFALAFGRAIRAKLPGLDEARAHDAYSRALIAICSKIDAHGAFTNVSQQTPPGDFAFYNSIEIGTAPFATGVCMMALSEALETWQIKES